ncbi:MAG: hypothetical protein ACKO8G_02600 [Actinomycetota bacterium]
MTARAPNGLRDFAKLHPGAEAVLQRAGRGTWDLVLIAVDGTWVRDVFPTPEAATAACEDLGVRLQRGWDDPRLARRMNRRDHWSTPDGQRRAR